MSAPDPGRRTQFTALAVPLATVALLLFLWPLVMVPRLSLAEAWAHLFGAWALLIVAIFALVQTAGRSRRHREPGRKQTGA
jgi:membrane associated rhomboid family serine protease